MTFDHYLLCFKFNQFDLFTEVLKCRHRMWLGFWHKYGVDAYLRLASYDHERLIDVFFGRFEMIADVIDIADKEAFYCYIARFIHMLRRGCSLRW